MTKVSVVLPAYNEELVIEDTLATLAQQDYPEKFEIIVCDNNSTDRTAELAAKMGAKVVLEKRKGTRFAYDTAMRNASGDLILVTNADVHLPKDWISRIVAEYDDSEVVGVGTKVRFFNAPDWVNWVYNSLDFISPKHAFWGTSMSCRREIFDKVGGFNHGVNTNEDAVFTLIIEKLGKVKILDDVVVEMDGRRFNNGLVSAIKQWSKSYGINSLYIQFNYLLFGEIKTLIRDFGDVRSATFGQGEQVQISVVIPAGNDQKDISKVLSDLESQDFDRRFQVFVVNDTSTDVTMQIAKLFPDVTAVNFPGVYDLSSKLKLLLNSLKSPVVAFTTPQAHLPKDWLQQIYDQFNKERKQPLDILSGPYSNEYTKILSSITNQTLDRVSNPVELDNIAMLTSVAKDMVHTKGDRRVIIAELETLVKTKDLNLSYATDFKTEYADAEAASVKGTFKKLFNI